MFINLKSVHGVFLVQSLLYLTKNLSLEAHIQYWTGVKQMSKNDEKEDKYKPDKGSTYEIMESARKGKKEKKK